MSTNFYEDEDGLQVYAGCGIEATIQEALTRPDGAAFTFNDVRLEVRPDSDPALLLRDFHRAMRGYCEGSVGPYPKAELSEAEKRRDAEVGAENERKRAAQRAEWERKDAEKREALALALSDAPPMEISNLDGWAATVAANSDGYGGAVIRYAEVWAQLMEKELRRGRELEDVADALSHTADTEGITGFQYGCAVSILAQCWAYGDRLRVWHNLTTQLRDEGERANEKGTALNPALLSFG